MTFGSLFAGVGGIDLGLERAGLECKWQVEHDPYALRILEDANQNGKWDPGEFFGKHLQPEIVRPVSRRISVKPAFENEFEIEAPSSAQ